MRYGGLFVVVFFISINALSQQTGFIVRQVASPSGRAVLDPNGDGYTSQTTSGFNGNDVLNSEIAYKAAPSFRIEPPGDIRRGPAHGYSDFVPGSDSSGFYAFFDGTNVLFRMRIGSVIPGSAAYSVLLDTDGKFGATGPNADPNYIAATSSSTGNPGFEIEIVLESNNRIAIYNVDGTNAPVLVKAYTNWQDMSQLSIASTSDNGDPDFLLDFFIPFSDLAAAPFNLITSSPLRMIATTVTAAKPAIGGPASDIYGIDDTGYNSTNNEYEKILDDEPPVTIDDVSNGGTGFGNICTAPPVVNSPLGTGTVNITGTWTMSSIAGTAGIAAITVYRNGTLIGMVPNVTSGTTWSLNGINLASGDVITAKAQSENESMCLVSNSVIAQACNASNISDTAGLTFTCATQKGMAGTMPAGQQVRLYRIDKLTLDTILVAGPDGGSSFSERFGYSAGNIWFFNSTNSAGQLSQVCSGGANDVITGTYFITTNTAGSGCQSAPVFLCLGNLTDSILTSPSPPIINQGAVYNNTTEITGSAANNAQVQLWINGQLKATMTAATVGGAYSFSGLSFTIGDVVEVRGIVTGGCLSNPAQRVVTCFTNPPLITVDNNNQLAAAAPVTGTSVEPAGTVIQIFTSLNVLVATTPVQANGTWSTGNAGTTPSTYNTIAGTTYYTTAQNGSCSVSEHSANATAAAATSATRCGSINSPITSDATSVPGTLSTAVANTTVHLYLDGVNIGNTTTNTTSWSVTIPANTLYAGGVLNMGVQEAGRREVICSASEIVACASPPPAPVISPIASTIIVGQTVTYTISNAVAGSFYGIADGSTGESLAAGSWASVNGDLNLTTNVFNAPGTYNLAIKNTSLSGAAICTSAPALASIIVEDVPLPVVFLDVSAKKTAGGVIVAWQVANEQDVANYIVERSTDCSHFIAIGTVAYTTANSNTNQYEFTDVNTLNGTVCYRIRQVDIDGKVHYSHIVRIKNEKIISMLVAPNPARESATLYMTSSVAAQVTISLMDANGKMVWLQYKPLNNGTNAILLDGLSRFSKGNYIITVFGPDGIFHQKLMLQ